MNISTAVETEKWAAHPDYPDYDVSTHGRIRSWKRREPQILQPGLGSNGYLSVVLYGENGRRAISVHKLVLEAHVGPKHPTWEVRHLNGLKTDNRLENLAWGTKSQNEQDKVKHGTSNHGERNGKARLTADQVEEARILHKAGAKIRVLAHHYRVSYSTMSQMLRGETWGHLAVVR